MKAFTLSAADRRLTTAADAQEVAAETERLAASRPGESVVAEAMLKVLARKRIAVTGEDMRSALTAVAQEHPDLTSAFRIASGLKH